MPIKNAGTATMRFREGIKVEGDDPHGSANQLVVTGSISVMEPTASGTTATLQSTANPTTSETTPSDWSYFSGLTNNSQSSSFEPRNPIQAIPIDDGGTWNSEIYAFEGSGVVNGVDSMRILAHKNTISGDSRLEFMLIGAGAFNSDHTQPHVAGDIKRPGFPNPTVFPNHTMGFNGFNWSGGSSDPLRDIKVMVATTGYGATDDWTQVGSVTYHAHPPGHPNSGTRNLNQHQFESFSVDITGITGNYYVGLVQNGSSAMNAWAAADVNLYSLSSSSSHSYINFEPQGTFYEGETGIGFRNNAGFMEYKDEGASWRQFNTLAIGPASPDRSVQFNDGGSLGSGNLFYGTNANFGIGDFSNGDPTALLSVQGNLGGSGNLGIVNISDRGVKPPIIQLQRSQGSLGAETTLSAGDSIGAIQFRGYNGTSYGTETQIKSEYETGGSFPGGSIIFSASETSDGALTDVLKLRGVALHPHDGIVTSNVGAFVLGTATNAFGTTYTENIRGPQGTDLKIVADNNDVVMHVGTQGTYANNVGIGTSTPDYPLVVQGTHTTEPDAMILNGTTSGPTLSVSRYEPNVSDVDSGQTLATIKLAVHSSAQLEACNIIAKATSDWNSNAVSGLSRSSQLVFQTTTALEQNIVTADRMTIDSQKVHCLDDLEVDGDCEIGNGLTVNLASNFGNHVYIDNNVYMNKWISHDTVTGRMSSIGSVQTTVELAEYTDGTMNTNPMLTFNPNNDDLRLQYRDTNGRETFRCDHDGLTYIGTDDGAPQYSAHGYSLLDSGGLYVEGEHTAGSVATIVNRGEDDDSDGLRIIIGYGKYGYAGDSPTVWYREPENTNSFLKFSGRSRGSGVTPTGPQYAENYDPDDLFECGRIAGDGNGGITIIGDTFTGTHDTISLQSIDIGMIIESSGELWISNGISCSLPKTQMTSTENSKSVFGVVSQQAIENGRAEKVPDGFSAYTVNSLGEGKIWITNISGEPTNGDYITSSIIAGHGQLQADDILHSYTVAKLIETIDWSTVSETVSHEGQIYKKYLAGCTYHCG